MPLYQHARIPLALGAIYLGLNALFGGPDFSPCTQGTSASKIT